MISNKFMTYDLGDPDYVDPTVATLIQTNEALQEMLNRERGTAMRLDRSILGFNFQIEKSLAPDGTRYVELLLHFGSDNPNLAVVIDLFESMHLSFEVSELKGINPDRGGLDYETKFVRDFQNGLKLPLNVIERIREREKEREGKPYLVTLSVKAGLNLQPENTMDHEQLMSITYGLIRRIATVVKNPGDDALTTYLRLLSDNGES